MAEQTESLTQTLDQFLQLVEKKAYKMAVISVRDHHEALDLVQEAMFKLATSYGDKSSNELKPLFYRILQNKITDWHRHQKLKNMLFFWQSNSAQEDDDSVLETASTAINSEFEASEQIQQQQLQQALNNAIATLSVQQQQCFLLRSWEGFSVAETAEILGCSQGSVKTHYSRATAKVKEVLETDYGYSI